MLLKGYVTKYNDNGLNAMLYRKGLLIFLLFSLLGNLCVQMAQIATAEGIVDHDFEVNSQQYGVFISPKSVVLGANIVVSGHVIPANSNATVELTYLSPNEVVIVRNTSSMFEGEFGDEFTPSVAGCWQVQATWEYNATHAVTSDVKYFKVYEGESTISSSISSISLTKGSTTTIMGKLDPPLANIPIKLKYKRDGEWHPLATIETTVNGSFMYSWLPLEAGEYQLKAYWSGDNTYSGAYSELLPVLVTSIASITTQNNPISEEDNPILSVQSNSTISQLIFDSEQKVLSIGVSGENGTAGYIKIVLTKALIPELSALQVYLDDESVSYNTESTVDSWIVTVHYHHSAHIVKVSLSANPLWGENQLLVISFGLVATALFTFLLRKSRNIALSP